MLLQAETDASSKDKELNEALERMRQYESVSYHPHHFLTVEGLLV